MFGSKDRHDDDRSTRTGTGDRAHGTHTDADVTSRMTGTGRHGSEERGKHGDHGDHGKDGDHGTHREHGEHRGVVTDTSRPAERFEERHRVLPAKTSAAAAFALVFGVSALFCALTGILAPVAVVLGLIGIVLGIVGMKKGRLPGVTGRGVAIGGLVTALLGLLLGAAVLAGAAVFVNDSSNLDRLQGWIDDARSSLPSGSEVVEQVPGS